MVYLLKDFDHFRNDKRVAFKKESVQGQEVIIISYMIADKEFWKIPLAKETRGITFDAKTGILLSLPFRKFFNVGETEETLPHNIDWVGAEVFDKRDGSMVTPVLIGNQVCMKTKKSFFSDVALQAQMTMGMQKNIHKFCHNCLVQNYTPIFEYTHPDHRIVLDYGFTPQLTLLGIRDNYTGLELSFTDVKWLASLSNVPIIIKYDKKDYENIYEDAQSKTNIEGWVILQKNGDRVKLKTAWYLLNHRLMTDLRERDVALAVADSKIDDLKSEITLQGKSLVEIEKIETRVVNELREIMDNAEDLLSKMKKEPTRKDAALMYVTEKVFPLAIKLYEGKEPDYIDFWKKHYLKNYSLRVVLNPGFSSEVEA
jgi:RNA ligase